MDGTDADRIDALMRLADYRYKEGFVEPTAERETWGRPFQPGQSGNLGGRLKVIAEVRDLARHHTALAIETLVHIMEHADKDTTRVAAAQALLDRAWGKPAQTLATSGNAALRVILEPTEVRDVESGR